MDAIRKSSNCKTESSKSNFYKVKATKVGLRPSFKICRKGYSYGKNDTTTEDKRIYRKNIEQRLPCKGKKKKD